LRELAHAVTLEFGALGGSRTRTSAMATRNSAAKLQAPRKYGHEHNAASCGTRLVALCSCPDHNKERTPSHQHDTGAATGFHGGRFGVSGTPPTKPLRLLFVDVGNGSLRQESSAGKGRALDTFAQRRLTLYKVAPQWPSQESCCSDRPAALPVDAGGAAFLHLKSSFQTLFLSFFLITATKSPAFLSEAGFTEYLDVTTTCFSVLPYPY
jgi:hypothetical protein